MINFLARWAINLVVWTGLTSTTIGIAALGLSLLSGHDHATASSAFQIFTIIPMLASITLLISFEFIRLGRGEKVNLAESFLFKAVKDLKPYELDEIEFVDVEHFNGKMDHELQSIIIRKKDFKVRVSMMFNGISSQVIEVVYGKKVHEAFSSFQTCEANKTASLPDVGEILIRYFETKKIQKLATLKYDMENI